MTGQVGPIHEFDPGSVASTSTKVLVVRASTGKRLRGILPPLLILMSALAATGYQFRPHGTRPSMPAAVFVTPRPSATPAPLVDEGELRVTVAAAPAAEISPTIPIDPAPLPTTSDAPLVPLESPADPEVSVAAAQPEARPPDRPVAEIVWNDIQAEADAAREERVDSEAARGEAFALRQEAQVTRLEKARNDAVANRGTFHNDLRTLIGRHGRRSGGYIAELITTYGREVEPEIHNEAMRLRATLASANVSPARSVHAYRQIGLPEPSILDELAERLRPTIGSRRGPRNAQEVLYFAAKMLLGVPPRPGL